ncbi:NAD-dependent succinate-semialdehyde dehydrogenase [Spelaeicoccus albus]|uniref:Succinate-semialdehyde dehydrogenase/glutarate-semialdehyde dehydrogenase n=1 Tax=Spelaeicoccus albus TaxID=1280376 RepID=A0A7Z0D4R6_9MICO|nr:NAD-dependent succinate-semialdehyde dehydrogenase [Spelaeicoccus albus]NYI68844.1 succinate-semialdehyde dehydrogenase/glutarate-semialdehyde dehydrogenase [Spelaeicoccus albus]
MTVTSSESAVISSVPKQLFIGGKWIDGGAGGTIDVVDPSTGTSLCSIADATEADGRAALDAAVAAQKEFAATSPRFRADILRRAFELLHERIDELALIMTLEMGKPLAESKGEIVYAAEFFRHFSEEAVRITGNYQTSPKGDARFIVTKQPVGPCILITPWNFPMAMGTRKIGPAIAAGCTSVIKPATLTPLSMLALADILREAGLPDGVVNVITTSHTGAVMEPLIRSGKARKLSFTGSTEVGVKLLEQSAEKVLRTSMELGGNAPLLVFEDADLDKAIDGVMAAKMRNGGEACTAANRIYVQRGIMEQFSARLSERMGALTVGRGTVEGTDVGPMVDGTQQNKVADLVDDAVSKGATVLTGGSKPDGDGFFYSPTVLSNVPADARLANEEIFGPVAPLIPFDDEDEAIEKANDSEFGLIAYVFTTELNRALRVSEALEAGMIGLNQGVVSNPSAPFGGVKASGLGREGGPEGIDEFLETKYIGMSM